MRVSDTPAYCIHRAPRVILSRAQPERVSAVGEKQESPLEIIDDGGVVTHDGLIKAVGRFRDLQREYRTIPVKEYEESVLTPALINAHAHLELSFFADIVTRKGHDSDLPAWIRQLVAARGEFPANPEELLQAGRASLDKLFRQGTAFVLDIGNQRESVTIGKDSPVEVLFLNELLGISPVGEENGLALLKNNNQAGRMSTVHAVYSSSPALIQQTKNRANQQGHILSIHLAESEEELEFLRLGSGPFAKFLEERGGWQGSFSPLGSGKAGAVDYLDRLGILDAATLCVHAVHITDKEVQLLAERRAKVCLCPGSNRYLGVGRAPVQALLGAGIRPALGTDSLASNWSLNLWQEMRILREEHPEIMPQSIFAMATSWGAEAVGLGRQLGFLLPGSRACFLAVGASRVNNNELFDFLTTTGDAIAFSWIDCR